jgi:hypothetical protein
MGLWPRGEAIVINGTIPERDSRRKRSTRQQGDVRVDLYGDESDLGFADAPNSALRGNSEGLAETAGVGKRVLPRSCERHGFESRQLHCNTRDARQRGPALTRFERVRPPSLVPSRPQVAPEDDLLTSGIKDVVRPSGTLKRGSYFVGLRPDLMRYDGRVALISLIRRSRRVRVSSAALLLSREGSFRACTM